jgi:hypothetical protein
MSKAGVNSWAKLGDIPGGIAPLSENGPGRAKSAETEMALSVGAWSGYKGGKAPTK